MLPRKWSRTKWVFFCLTIVGMTFLYRAAGTVGNVLDGMWVRYQSPYPIKAEFLENIFLRTYRPAVSKITFGIADEWLVGIHKGIVEDVKKKTAPDDMVWVDFWYDAEAKFWRSENEYSEQHVEQAREKLLLLLNGKSRVVGFEKESRYLLWSRLLKTIANGNLGNYNYTQKMRILQELRNQSEIVAKQIDIAALLRYKNSNAVPMVFLDGLQDMYLAILNSHSQNKDFDCSSQDVKDFRYLIYKIIELGNLYKNLDTIPKVVEQNVLIVNKARRAEDSIKRRCN